MEVQHRVLTFSVVDCRPRQKGSEVRLEAGVAVPAPPPAPFLINQVTQPSWFPGHSRV